MVKKKLKKYISLNHFKTFLFLCLAYFVFSYSIHRPCVLIIHSYDPADEWVQDFDLGVKTAFKKDFHLVLKLHYMNVLGNKSLRYHEQASKMAENAVKEIKPAVVILVGDEAQEYCGKSLVKNPAIHLIFAGVKGNLASYNYKPGINISGVHNTNFLDVLQDTINHMHIHDRKKPDSFAYLSDDSTQSLVVRDLMHAYSWKGVKLHETIIVGNFDDWKKSVVKLNADKNVHAIIIADCISLLPRSDIRETPDSVNMDGGEVMDWTMKNTNKPVIGLERRLAESGIDVVVNIAGYTQGKRAAEIAKRYLHSLESGVEKGVHEFVDSSEFSVYLNKKRMKYTRLQLPLVYTSLAAEVDGIYE